MKRKLRCCKRCFANPNTSQLLRSSLYFGWLTLSTGTPESSSDEVLKQSRNEWAERAAGYIERSLLIVLGATVTVVAGFLSQVWSSASTAFRMELADNLKSISLLFTTAFILPSIRLAVEYYKFSNSKHSQRAFGFWCVGAVIVFTLYMQLVDQLGDIVMKYAKVVG